MITPQIHIDTGFKTEYKFYKTYHKDLVKDIANVMTEFGVKTVTVIRSKRGEWGEWFERWDMDYRCKPEITKQGWS